MSTSLPPVPPLEPPAPTPGNPDYEPYYLAVVIDNVVYESMSTDAKHAAILLARPVFVQISSHEDVRAGYTYDPTTGTFSA